MRRPAARIEEALFMAIYRVTYPLFTMDGHRDFTDLAAAEEFARQRRNDPGNHQTLNAWRLVDIKELPPDGRECLVRE